MIVLLIVWQTVFLQIMYFVFEKCRITGVFSRLSEKTLNHIKDDG